MEIKHRTELNKLMPKRKLVGVEVGVAQGLNANDMLTNWNMKMLYLVDIWKCLPGNVGDAASPQSWHESNLDNVRSLMEKHKGKYKLLRGLSNEVAKDVKNNSLDFVYIDCDHSYEGVKSDLATWFPKLKKGAVMAGHDVLNQAYGVEQAVMEFCKDRFEVFIVPEHKAEDASFYFIKP
jgi:predicted O-methyltransferase YrrM